MTHHPRPPHRCFLAAFLPLLLSAILLSGTACQKDASDAVSTDSFIDTVQSYEGETVPVAADTLSSYVITRSDTCGETAIQAAIALRKAIEPYTPIGLTTDFVNERRGEAVPEDRYEILVGTTNRTDSQTMTAGLRYHEFVIGQTEKHIVIAGGSEEATASAVDFFIQHFITDEGISLPEEIYIHRHTYPIESLSLNGCPVETYTIVADRSLADSLPQQIADVLIEQTGYTLPIAYQAKGPSITLNIADLPADICRIRTDGDAVLLEGSDNDTVLCAAKVFFHSVLSSGNTDSTSLSIAFDTPVEYDCTAISAMEPIVYTIPADSDPTDAIEAVFVKMRTESLLTLAPQVVEFESGEYRFTKPIVLDVSGTRYAPLTIRAAAGADVQFTGAIRVDPAEVKPVTNEAILQKLADPAAAEHLSVLDLSPYLETVEAPYYHGSGTSTNPMTIYWGESALMRSRWPNHVIGEAYLYSGDNISFTDYQTGPVTYNYIDPTDHAKEYWSEETVQDLYVFGYLGYDWYNDPIKVQSLDFDQKIVTTASGMTYEPHQGTRFYFYNLIEEIDVPGESYIDTDNRLLYFYPYDTETDNLRIAVYEEPFFQINGAENVVIDGISMQYTRDKAISGTELSSLTIQNCTITHTSSNAMSLSGDHIIVDHCTIYDTWTGGINISGGDRTSLTSGESTIANCVIHDVNRSEETYKPGIAANSVGLQILNNTLYGNTHEMIAVGSNDIVIRYNEIYNCVTECSDMGAIYYGRNPTILGIDIGYNYFHDIGNVYGGIGQQAIFCDDGSMGPWVHDNIFYRATNGSAAYKAHAAQYTLAENNIFVDMAAAFFNAAWEDGGGKTRQTRWCEYMYGDIWDRMAAVPFESETWRARYEGTIWANVWNHLSTEVENQILDDSIPEGKKLSILRKYAPDTTNVLENNVAFAIDETNVSGKIWNGGAIVDINNVLLDSESDFMDYGVDFALTEEALARVRAVIPDFRNIDMTNIGPQK